MKKSILLLLFIAIIIGCEQRTLSPSSNVLEGNYTSDGFLDFLCIALRDDQMPQLNFVKTSADQYEAQLTTFVPQKKTVTYAKITTKPTANGDTEFFYKGKPAGSWATGKVWNKAKNREEDGKVVKLTINNPDEKEWVYFVGRK